jgi:hypothetical protein
MSSENLSEYELLRLQNIQRNEEFLRQIGVGSEGLAARASISLERDLDGKEASEDVKIKKRARPLPSKAEVIPTRRSSRLDPTQSQSSSNFSEYEDYQYISDDDGNENSSSKKPATFEVKIDDESADRNEISAEILRDIISVESATNLEKISDEAILHCVHRIRTMSNKKLATRLKMISKFVQSNLQIPT